MTAGSSPGFELRKNDMLAEAIAAAIHARGGHPDTAFLAAGAAMLARQVAFQKWTLPGETRTLRDLLADAAHSLRTAVRQQPAGAR